MEFYNQKIRATHPGAYPSSIATRGRRGSRQPGKYPGERAYKLAGKNLIIVKGADMITQTKDDLEERAFAFLRVNEREAKPRSRGVTEIRGPYYTPMGKRYLEDILETMGTYIDVLKFAGGSFSLMPRQAVKEL